MRTTLFLLAIAMLATGCNPCKEACRVESRQFETCLGDWGLEWIDLGATDRPDYRRSCVADVDVWLDGLPIEEQATERRSCQALVTDLRGETDCDAAWEALRDYGTVE